MAESAPRDGTWGRKKEEKAMKELKHDYSNRNRLGQGLGIDEETNAQYM